MKLNVKAGFLRSISVVVVLAMAGIILITAGLLRCTVAAAQSVTSIPSTLFGMSLIGNSDWPSVSIGALAKGTGVNWSYTEKTQGVYDWTRLDAWVNLASSHGLSFFYSNNLVPPWAAADQSTCKPTYTGSSYIGCTSMVANIADWDAFVTALVNRYGNRMIYELWNEPDSSKYTGSIADMVTLTTHEYNIIRNLAPTALILAPSPTPATCVSWEVPYFNAGGPQGVDVLTVHGYRESPEHTATDIANCKAAWANFSGLSGKPIWDTEGSWQNVTLTDNQESGYVARSYLLHWSSGVSRFYWYAWDSPTFGTMWDSATGPHPDATGFQQVYNWMVGATMSSPCTMASDSTWTCTLTRPGGYRAQAVWNSATTTSYTPTSQYQQYLDLAGNTNPVSGSVTIGYNPILLVSSAAPAPPTNLTITVQ
jgi:hypothetical protein